jgi:hypothetical protein
VRALAAATLLAALAALGGCSKCDMPTYGWASPFAPAACSGETPRR